MKIHYRTLILLAILFVFASSSAAQNSPLNTDGFMNIKYGSSMAEVRRIIAAGNIGTISESESDKDLLVITGAKINYDLKKYKILWSENNNMILLYFMNDKFYRADVVLPEFVDTFQIFGGFEEIKQDFDRMYYKTNRYIKGDNAQGLAVWEFKQPKGGTNYIRLGQSAELERLMLLIYNGELTETADQAAAQKEKNRKIAEEFYSSASKYYKDGKYDLALTDYTNALNLAPDNKDSYHFRGHSNHALKKYEAAVADFTSALKYDPENTHYLNDRAASYTAWSETKFDLALADLNKAIKIKPNDARPYLLRARIFCAQGKKALAAADEKDAVSLGGEVKEKCG